MNGDFGSYVKKIRGKRTKKDVATRSGFTAEYLRRIEDENKVPSQNILYKLAKGLNVDPKELTFQALKEKAPAATKHYFAPIPNGPYPKIRSLLLSYYIRSGSEYASSIEIKKRLNAFSGIGPLEELLYKEIYAHLVAREVAPQDSSKDAWKYYLLNSLNDLGRKTYFKTADFEWSYNNEHNFVIITFKGSERVCKAWGLKWYTYNPIPFNLRKALLCLYSEFKKQGVNDISKMYSEPYMDITHIEEKLIDEAYKYLIETGMIKGDTKALIYFSYGSEQEIRERVEQVINRWSYDLNKDILRIDLKSKTDKILTKRFALWHEIS